ncbi:BLUF domain-containing protein [Comamonas testosteroni]|uniref:BLUF domain-containing protein n=1 Tax=Comamonas testosteroni TaxID=285 RepID=UPI001E404B80|nr:BLUF domain-containing protein [Comamonas testosteroni]
MSVIGCFLYHSEIAADADIGCVAEIAKFSRTFNEAHDITGVLIFDGQRFVQYIEGPLEHVTTLANKIAIDARHKQFTLLHEAQGITQRLFPQWAMAYVTDDDAEPLATVLSAQGDAALSGLQKILPQLDAA